MAIIFCVHGTYVSGSESGDQWWQRSSLFHQDLRKFVAAEDGELTLAPFAWDGKNSEVSRQAAGARLCQKLALHEKDGRHYALVGHSHGGSVISNGFLRAKRRQKFDLLSSWLTVGTPFLQTAPRKLLFSRLSPPGKAAYMIFSLLFLMTAGGFYLAFRNSAFEQINSTQMGGFLLLIMIPIAVYIPMRLFGRKRNWVHALKKHGARKAALESSLVCLWHASDEAIRSLHLAGKVRIKPFSSQFAVSVISLASIFVIPTLILFMSTIDGLAEYLIETYSSLLGGRLDQAFDINRLSSDLTLRIVSTFYLVVLGPTAVVGSFVSKAFGVDLSLPAALFLFLGGVIFSLFILWVISLAIQYLIAYIAFYLSKAMSSVLNRMTQSQLRNTALGSDAQADYVVAARSFPQWMEKAREPLPDALAAEITKTSDPAPANSISQIRDALGQAALADNEGDFMATLSQHLNGNELIHTTYFAIPRFRKLVAYAIAQGPGFKATASFEADADYAIVAEWHRQMQQARDAV